MAKRIFQNKIGLGFTLFELLISLSLGLLLLTIAMQSLVGLFQRVDRLMSLASMEQNAEVSLALLQKHLQENHYRGCFAGQEMINHTHLSIPNSWLLAYHGMENNWQPALPATLKGQVEPNTDVIESYYLHAETARVAMSMDSLLRVVTTAYPAYQAGDVIAITDCHAMELNVVANVWRQSTAMQVLTFNDPFTYRYSEGAAVSELLRERFFVTASSRLDDSGRQIGELFIEDIHDRKQALAAGVSALSGTWTVSQHHRLQELPLDQLTAEMSVMGLTLSLLAQPTYFLFHAGKLPVAPETALRIETFVALWNQADET